MSSIYPHCMQCSVCTHKYAFRCTYTQQYVQTYIYATYVWIPPVRVRYSISTCFKCIIRTQIHTICTGWAVTPYSNGVSIWAIFVCARTYTRTSTYLICIHIQRYMQIRIICAMVCVSCTYIQYIRIHILCVYMYKDTYRYAHFRIHTICTYICTYTEYVQDSTY